MNKSLIITAQLALLSLALFAVIPVTAQAQVVCPAGYTCTPIVTKVLGCPDGYTCTPITGSNSDGAVTPTSSVSVPSSNTVVSSASNGNGCYPFDTNLTIGSSGSDVVALQTWLVGSGFDIPAVSSGRQSKGYYSYQTAAALAKYQASAGVPATGYFGSMARSKINSSCSTRMTSTTTSQMPMPPRPLCTTDAKMCPDGSYVSRDPYNQCQFRTCSSGYSQYPVISGITAPTTLNVGQAGTWIVNARDPNNGYLSYSVDWGDNPTYYLAASTAQSFVQTATFTHAYSSSGTYTATFTVKNNAGLTAQSSVTVKVGGIQTAPILKVSLDPSSPIAATIKANQNGFTLAVIDLTAGQDPVDNLNNIQIGSDSSDARSKISNIKIYDGSTLLGTASSLDYNSSYYYQWISVSGVSIHAYSSKQLRIVGDIPASVTGPLRVGIAGLNFDPPGATVVGTPAYGSVMTITAPTDQSPITVVRPNGGEKLIVGQPNAIAWNTTGFSTSDDVYISLHDSSLYCAPYVVGCWTTFSIANVKNTGIYTWDTNTYFGDPGPNNPLYLSRAVSAGAVYKIGLKIVGSNGVTATDSSDDNFTIAASTNTQPSVTVLSPNGGESYVVGGKMTIGYSVTSAPSGSYLTLSLINGPSPINVKSLAAPSGVERFDYTVPASGCSGDLCYDLKPGTYNIEAILFDKQPCGAMVYCTNPAKVLARNSSGSFTITAPPTQSSITVDQNPLSLTMYQDQQYSHPNVVLTGAGSSQISWQTVSGSLPPGIVPNYGGTTYELLGTPSQVGTYSAIVRASDFYNSSSYTNIIITITVVPGPEVPPPRPTTQSDQSYQNALTASIWNAVKEYFSKQGR